jgi:hypothetical protein
VIVAALDEIVSAIAECAWITPPRLSQSEALAFRHSPQSILSDLVGHRGAVFHMLEAML